MAANDIILIQQVASGAVERTLTPSASGVLGFTTNNQPIVFTQSQITAGAVNGPVGATTPSTGAFTTLSATGQVKSQTGSGITHLFGADVNATTITNATQKVARLGLPHYTNAEEPVAFALLDSSAGSTLLALGGGSGLLNAVQTVSIYAAAGTTTTTGSLVANFTSTGLAVTGSFSVTAPSNSAAYGSLIGLGGGSFPTLASAQGTAYGNPTLGLVLAGNGSSNSTTITTSAGASIAAFNSTGLAVTGQVTTTGNVGVARASNIYARLIAENTSGTAVPTLGTGSGHFAVSNGSYGVLHGVTNGGLGWIQAQRTDGTGTAYNLQLNPAGGDVVLRTNVTASSTGLAVTGGLSATQAFISTGALPANQTSATAVDFFSNTSRYFSYGAAATNGQHLWLIGQGGESATQYMSLSTTGLAVTGALSATGAVASTGANLVNSANKAVLSYEGSGLSFLQAYGVDNSTQGQLYIRTNTANASAATVVGIFSSTGLAVTGQTTSTGDAATGVMISTSSASASPTFRSNNTGGSGTRQHMTFRESGTERGSITSDGANTAYNTSSDARLKTNIRDYSPGALIDSLQPRIFDWKSGQKDSIGFVAQELHAVYPQAVTAGDDGEEIEQSWGVDFSKLVPLLVAEVKSLRARVARLESNA